MTIQRYRDRAEAGRLLAARLTEYAHARDVLVLALPRGGVPVGKAVAEVLGVPLDIFLVRKLGVPGQEELAMGAVATGGVEVINDGRVWISPASSQLDQDRFAAAITALLIYREIEPAAHE